MPSAARRPVVDSLERRQLFAAILSSVSSQPIGALTGRIIYASGGHGYTANSSGLWSTGRGVNNGIVEDFGNQDQLTYFADAAWRAGATVVPMRPVGNQANEAVVDNQQATFTGSWSDGTATSYFSTTNGNGSRYAFASASATETAVAKFTPTLAAAGFYPVYAWAADGTNRITDQTYRVNHAGGATEVKVDHTRVGKGWVYLGTYRFNAGTAGNVEVSNKTSGATSGKYAIADAIRFGNGRGSVVRNGNTSGRLREDEASLYWIEASAGWTGPGARVSSSNWRTSATSDDVDANVAAPLRWARYMNAAPLGQSVYLSFHSNAGGGRGTDGLYNDTSRFPGTATPNQKAWATLVGKEVTDDLVALGAPPLEAAWQNDANPIFARSDYAFGEIRGDTNGNEFDATILEVAYHDDVTDANLMKAPLVRAKVAQSSVQAAQKYFDAYGGAPTIAFAPDAPTDVVAVGNPSTGNIDVKWKAPATSSIFGGAPTGYVVYASSDGYSFDGGRYVAGATTTETRVYARDLLNGSSTAAAYFKVVAVNAGGESPASSVVAARGGNASYGRVLIVDGFDRLDRTQNAIEPQPVGGTNSATPGSPSSVTRVRPRAGNSFDYAVQHAQAILAAPNSLGFDTATNEAVLSGKVGLGSYQAVIWISGEESSADRTFDAAEQKLVTTYLGAGGKVMVSGSEVGYELVGKGAGSSFFTSTLRSGYVGDDAGTYAASGVAGSIFAGLSLSFDNGANGTYDVDYPDRLTPGSGATAVLSYVGGAGGTAATAFANATTGARTLVMGFGFETITSAAVRADLMKRALDFFGLDVPRSPVKPGSATARSVPPPPTTTVAKKDDGKTPASAAAKSIGLV